jgi:drug/metabolite transporter (DMT)-like permease
MPKGAGPRSAGPDGDGGGAAERRGGSRVQVSAPFRNASQGVRNPQAALRAYCHAGGMSSRARGQSLGAPALGAPAVQVAVALGILYIVWGSTYLAIRVAVVTIPPLLGSGIRFVIAGSILYLVTGRQCGGQIKLVQPTRAQWRDAAIIGACLLGGGNGLLSIGEVTVASGIAALIIGTMPMWVALIGRLAFGMRIDRLTVAGIALGLLGVAILVGPAGDIGQLDPLGVAVLLGSPILWALGSLYSRGASHPERPLLGVAMQMLCGGTLLVCLGVATGEAGSLRADQVSPASVEALVYLIGVGSLIGYSSYGWLLRVAPLSLISTYAYVNPVVAVILGSVILGEPLTPRTIAAAAIIVVAVSLIVTAGGRRAPAPDDGRGATAERTAVPEPAATG